MTYARSAAASLTPDGNVRGAGLMPAFSSIWEGSGRRVNRRPALLMFSLCPHTPPDPPVIPSWRVTLNGVRVASGWGPPPEFDLGRVVVNCGPCAVSYDYDETSTCLTYV